MKKIKNVLMSLLIVVLVVFLLFLIVCVIKKSNDNKSNSEIVLNNYNENVDYVKNNVVENVIKNNENLIENKISVKANDDTDEVDYKLQEIYDLNKKYENKEEPEYILEDSIFKENEEERIIFLCNGLEIPNKIGCVKFVEYFNLNMEEDYDKALKKYFKEYDTIFYNYEDGEYKGASRGIFYDFGGLSHIINVDDFAINKKYDLTPRKSITLDNIPKELDSLKNYSNVKLKEVDLDGDGKKEYIGLYTKIGQVEEYEQLTTTVTLYNNELNEVGKIVTVQSDIGEVITIDDVHFLDIDNDGIMEIVVILPGYEWFGVNILKYANNELQGEKDIFIDCNYNTNGV